MLDKIIRNKNRKKMFESETDFEINKCIFCESNSIIVIDRFGNKFKCENCKKEFSAQDIEKFVKKGYIKEINKK